MKQKIAFYNTHNSFSAAMTAKCLKTLFKGHFDIVHLAKDAEQSKDVILHNLVDNVEYFNGTPTDTKLVVIPGFTRKNNWLGASDVNKITDYVAAGGNVLAVCDGANQLLTTANPKKNSSEALLPSGQVCGVIDERNWQEPRLKQLELSSGERFNAYNEIGMDLHIPKNIIAVPLLKRANNRQLPYNLYDSALVYLGRGKIVYTFSHVEVPPVVRLRDFERVDVSWKAKRIKLLNSLSEQDDAYITDIARLIYRYIFEMSGNAAFKLQIPTIMDLRDKIDEISDKVNYLNDVAKRLGAKSI
jgi:hypothetical protein